MRELVVLPAVLRRARRLSRDDQDTRAGRLLQQALAVFDPVTARHDPRLIRAAVQYIETLSFDMSCPDRADIQLAWVRYAQSAAWACYGLASPIWRHVAGLYAGVCTAQGLTFDATLMLDRILRGYLAYGPEECIPGAWEKLAVALHADGQCEQAHTEIRKGFSYWKQTGVPGQPAGGELLRTYAAVLAGCGHTEAARTLLTDHADLAAMPRATDRQAAAFITAVHIAMAERDHPPICTLRPDRQPPPPGEPDRWQMWKAILLPSRSPPHCVAEGPRGLPTGARNTPGTLGSRQEGADRPVQDHPPLTIECTMSKREGFMSPVTEHTTGSAEALRAAMVERLREEDAIVSDAVAAAFSRVPRHVFAPGEPLEKAYETQTTLLPKTDADGTETSVVSAAFLQAVELEQAQIEPGMRVLELGSGGYNAALMAELVGPDGEATTVDIDPVITDRASSFLKNAGYDRVRVIQSDGEHGVCEHGPFDRIVVTFGAWDIAPAWLDQLADDGRIVVPLRFAGLTRLIAFERSAQGLVGDSYRLAAFVPAQGDGAFDEELVPITSEVGLRLDRAHSETFDVPALRTAMHSPAIERWSGAAFDLPDELALFLATSAPVVPILHVSQNMVDEGVFALSARRGIPALVEGGSFAYRTKRESDALGGFESGVVAHGPDAEALAERYAELLRQWAANYRYRHAARIEYLPNGTDAGDVSGWHVAKRHGVVSVTWP